MWGMMRSAGNRLKAATGMAMSALGRAFAPGEGAMCEKHGVRLRMMKRNSYRWSKESLCPVCHRRTITMKAYPFKMYFSACGLIWSAVILAVILAVVFGAIPGIRAIGRHRAESKAVAAETATAAAETVGSMPREWASLYRMLKKVHVHRRTEAFMDFLTGSREFEADKRSPILVALPQLDPDGVELFMGLFWLHERDELMPVLAKLAAGPQDAP